MASLTMTHCHSFLALVGMQKMIVLYALKVKSICPSNLQKQIMSVNQHGVDTDGTNQSNTETWYELNPVNPVVGAFFFSLSVSPLYLLCQYTPACITGVLSSTQPLKTQSLKNKYIMPMAVKQVGVVAV